MRVTDEMAQAAAEEYWRLPSCSDNSDFKAAIEAALRVGEDQTGCDACCVDTIPLPEDVVDAAFDAWAASTATDPHEAIEAALSAGIDAMLDDEDFENGELSSDVELRLAILELVVKYACCRPGNMMISDPQHIAADWYDWVSSGE